MIHYLTGDATQPIGDGPAIIAHVCNDVGGWGAGFSGALSRRYPKAERSYRQWFIEDSEELPFMLGHIRFVEVASGVWLAHRLAQRGYSQPGKPSIRYFALKLCLSKLERFAEKRGLSIHMPRIGCGLAGGTWDKVEPLIEVAMGGLDVYVYDLE